MSDLDDQLRVGGQKVSEGVFRVDAKRALAKLREYRLADPHHWVLEVLRAASSAKARSVDIETDTDDIILRFDGKPFSSAVMKDLLAQALDSTGQDGERRAARYLSLGIAGALGLNPKWIKIRSGQVALEIHPPDDVTVSAAKEQGTFIHVRKRFGWSVVKAALADVTPEERAIVDRARRYGPTLNHNKRRIDGDELFKGGLLVSSAYTGEGMELIVGVPATGAGGQIVFDIDGVVVARRELVLPGRFIVAWARCDRMRRNASGSDVVDSDPAVLAVREQIRQLAFEVTQKMGALMTERKLKDTWRTRYRDYALECFGDLRVDPEIKAALAKFPLVPGLYDEWFSPHDFELEATAGRPVYFALEHFPRGSYPKPMALLQSATVDPVAKLLPAKRINATKLIRANARAAVHKHRWLGSPIEDRLLPSGSCVGQAPVSGSHLSGEVGLVPNLTAGAFVRFLCQGRFVQQGDVAALAPLRLRAVVDYQKDVPDRIWAEIPSDKLWGLVLDAIKQAAEKAVLDGLVSARSKQFISHGRDLVVRRATAGGRLTGLPGALRDAALFELAGGGSTSLSALEARKTWWHVDEPTDATLLSGEPVLILPPELREAVDKLAPKRLARARERLQQEKEIRERLAGPKKGATLSNVQVTVELEGEGLKGQVGLSAAPGSGLRLTLLRDGIPIETTSLTATYGFAHAIVDCSAFGCNSDWDTVVRDAVFNRALSAVRAAEHRLAGAVISHFACSLDLLPPGPAQLMTHFLRKHLQGRDPRDPEADRVENASLFLTQEGPISLAAIRMRLGAAQRLWTLPVEADEAPPTGLLVVKVIPEHAALLADLLGVRTEDFTAELGRIKKRTRYRDRPMAELALPSAVTLGGPLTAPGVSGVIGLSPSEDRGSFLDVVVDKRLFIQARCLSNLPLRGVLEVDGVDPADPDLRAEARASLTVAVRVAEEEILGRVVLDLGTQGARRAALLALQSKLDRSLPTKLSDALLDLQLFPCTDGVRQSARVLDRNKKLLFVTAPVHGASVSKVPVVVAVDPELRQALSRWPLTEDVTASLQRELDARASRLSIRPLETIALGPEALWRRQLHEPDLEGELGIVLKGGGRVELLHERRPISVIEGALPAPFSAIFNSDKLTPAPFDKGVVLDAQYRALLERLATEGELLLDRVADALIKGREDERKGVAPLLAPLTFWLVSRKMRGARLVKIPLFETTEGAAVSLQDILDEHKRNKSVLWANASGAPLNKSRWVLLPRAGELLLLEGLKVKLKDANVSLRHAEEVRSRLKVADLTVSCEGAKEKVATARLQGEVGLRALPSHLLVIELHRESMLLETFSAEHPVGALSRVNCDALTPNSDWTRATRNSVFKQVIGEVEDAVERLVARRLDTKDVGWSAWAEAAILWKRAPGGPLATVIPRLEVFTAMDGTPVTVGAVYEEHSRSGRVLVAQRGLPPPKDRLVLATWEGTGELLRALELKTEDATALLKRSGEIAAGLQQRRLQSLQYEGAPIARLTLEGNGLQGELVIVGEDEEAAVVLAKDGIRVCSQPIGKLPIAGVVNVDGLEVNEEWTSAVVPRPLKAQLDDGADQLFAFLATIVPNLPASEKARARIAALAYLKHHGITSAAHLERMTGAAAALASAPLFLAEDGQWVPLRAIADQVLRVGWISVFAKAWRKRDTLQELVLRADRLRDGWISSLEDLLGASCVERVNDVELWRKQLAERDPAPATPEGEGLRRLRKEMRLLRAGALGHVTPDELEDVRVRSDGAKAPITYDPERKLALLDGTDPQIARALEEIPRRPERIYVLLAAIYGSVNRALEGISDADESHLLTGLAAHLAANPKCLGAVDPD